ncbi:MAG: hypothetical protein D3923_09925 [Candidatus Electrothrix sp. AR3]|nr:hypothetical protein [Candidatus Electrothrix sp. AR3]
MQTIIGSMRHLAAAGSFMPEQLLSVLSGSWERQYIANLLMHRAQGEENGRALCDELLAWLQSMQKQKSVAGLEQQLRLAEQAKDDDLVLELQKKIIEIIVKTNC